MLHVVVLVIVIFLNVQSIVDLVVLIQNQLQRQVCLVGDQPRVAIVLCGRREEKWNRVYYRVMNLIPRAGDEAMYYIESGVHISQIYI